MSLHGDFKNYFVKSDKKIDDLINEEYYLACLFFSQIAYFKDTTLFDYLEELGAQYVYCAQRNTTQAYLAVFDEYAVVSFKGTEATVWWDLKSDLQFWKTNFNGIHAHTGFVNCLKAVSDEIIEQIKEKAQGKKIIFTGHSLGGALATLLAFEYKPSHLCTFGSPRVSFGKKFKEHFANVKTDRLVTYGDWIRILPPKFLFYEHLTKPIILPCNKNIFDAHLLTEYIKGLVQFSGKESG